MRSTSSKAANRADSLDDALESALQQLGIQRARFAALGPEQQRLALQEAILTAVKELNVGANWVLNAAHFSGTTLSDFSIEEIRQHHHLVHALVALVCLGESAYVRPLVAYLSFPEPRWSLFIEPVLRALSNTRVPPSLHGLRSPRALRTWRSWAATLPTTHHITSVGMPSSASVSWDVCFQTDVSDTLWLLSSHQWSESHSEIFDSEIAKHCARTFYDTLAEARFDDFVRELNVHLQRTEFSAFSHCDTVAACLRDRVTQLDARAQLFDAWSAVRRDVSPRTNIVLFQLLKPSKSESRFARRWVDDLLGDATELERHAVVGLLRQRPALEVAYELLNMCANLNDVTPSTRVFVQNAAPFVMRFVVISLRRELTDDTHNLCLLSNEDNLGRPALTRRIGARRKALENNLSRIGGLSSTHDPFTQYIGSVVEELAQRRTAATPSGSEWKVQTRSYLGSWVAVLNEWLTRRWDQFVAKQSAVGQIGLTLPDQRDKD